MDDNPKRWWCWCIQSDCKAEMYGPYKDRDDAQTEANVGCEYAHGIALLSRSEAIDTVVALHATPRPSLDMDERRLILEARCFEPDTAHAHPIDNPTPAEEFAS